MNEARKNLKWLLLGFGALAAATVGVFLLIAWQAGQQLDQKIAALQAAGEPVSIAELEPLPQLPTLNADTYLRKAQVDIDAIDLAVSKAEVTLSPAEKKAFDDLCPLQDMQGQLRIILADHAGAFPLLESASHCPTYQPLLDYRLLPDDFSSILMPHFQLWRATFRALRYRVLVQLSDGEREEALETCLTMFRLARLFDTSPLVVSRMLTSAVRGVAAYDTNLVLRSGPLSDATRAALDTELALQDVWGPFRQSLHDDRAYAVQKFATEPAGPLGLRREWLPAAKHDQCNAIDLLQTAIETEPLPDDTWRSTIGTWSGVESRAEIMRCCLLQLHEMSMRDIAWLRSLRVLNAIQARSKREQAVALDELELPAEVTIDPYNDKPLIVKSTPGGWLVYSVGKNLKDDGGDIESWVDVGFGPLPATGASGAPTGEAASGKSDADSAEPKGETE